MREWIRGLSGGSETLLVLLVAFGVVIPRSLAALFGGLTGPAVATPITNPALLATVVYELLIMSALAAFLRVRGWTLSRIGLHPTLPDSALGVALAAGSYLGYLGLWVLVVNLWPQIARLASATHLVSHELTWPSMLLVSAVNPLFEEVFLCGYVIAALKERIGLTGAVNVSAGIRVFCHFYQGAVGVLGIVPVALLFAYWYARSGRLWPLIVAHAILDLAGLLAGR